MRVVLNVVLLYASWFATVLAAANERPIMAAAASLSIMSLNVLIAPRPSAELRLIGLAALVGLAVDASMINLGLAQYAAAGPISFLPPFWLLTVWMAFATSLNVSLRWLRDRLSLAAGLGAVAGPVSYYAGARLGAMEFAEPLWLGLLVLAALWAVAFPLLLWFARDRDVAE